ncbi:MAG TPA: S-adenosylmethionine decarboxylase [Candidatus Paceibacterota bacterium]
MEKNSRRKTKQSNLKKEYADRKCWGLLASLDLYECAPDKIRKPKEIEKFIVALCTKIKMKRYGKAQIKKFGEGDLYGYSALQFIETSSVTMHFDEGEDRAFIEIFSCKFFEPKEALVFCQKYLGAKTGKLRYYLRY